MTLENQHRLAKNANIMCLNYKKEEDTWHSEHLKVKSSTEVSICWLYFCFLFKVSPM